MQGMGSVLSAFAGALMGSGAVYYGWLHVVHQQEAAVGARLKEHVEHLDPTTTTPCGVTVSTEGHDIWMDMGRWERCTPQERVRVYTSMVTLLHDTPTRYGTDPWKRRVSRTFAREWVWS